MERKDKINTYLDAAEVFCQRGTCLRRVYGAVIVKNDNLIAEGYSEAPRGRKNCGELGYCIRNKLGVPRGKCYEMCRSVHAEANAIIVASRNDMLGSTLYLVGRETDTDDYVKNAEPCSMCKRLILNAGIETVIVRDTKDSYRVFNVNDWAVNDDSIDGKDSY